MKTAQPRKTALNHPLIQDLISWDSRFCGSLKTPKEKGRPRGALASVPVPPELRNVLTHSEKSRASAVRHDELFHGKSSGQVGEHAERLRRICA